jgi:hypothetical protein
MRLHDVLAALAVAHVRFRREGDNLAFDPPGNVSPALLAELRLSKPSLLAVAWRDGNWYTP